MRNSHYATSTIAFPKSPSLRPASLWVSLVCPAPLQMLGDILGWSRTVSLRASAFTEPRPTVKLHRTVDDKGLDRLGGHRPSERCGAAGLSGQCGAVTPDPGDRSDTSQAEES